MLLVPLLVTLVLTLFDAAVAEAERWRPPLREVRVSRAFDFDADAPFARGAIRGTRLAAPPGTLVRAPCAGRVTFAGRHPRLGLGISLRCGRLVATQLGLERTLVRRRSAVPAGHPVGRLGAAGVLHLGARVAARRFGYLDPLTLIAAGSAPPMVAPVPRRSSARPAPPPPPAPAPVTAAGNAPSLAWLGIALAGIGAGLGTTLRAKRRPKRAGGAWSRTEWSAIRRRP